jgi:hypothetical protein
MSNLVSYYWNDGDDIKITVDQDIIDFAPDYEKSFLLWFHLKTDDETIYKTIFDYINKNYDTIYIGFIQRDSWVEWFSYRKDAKGFEKVLKDAVQKFSPLVYEFGSYRDKYWHHYKKSMYPDKIKKQLIENILIVDEVQKSDLDLTNYLKLEHFFQFKSADTRNIFKEISRKDGYEFADEYEDEEAYSLKFGLVLNKKSLLTQKEVDRLTLYHFEKVKISGGFYLGWGVTA